MLAESGGIRKCERSEQPTVSWRLLHPSLMPIISSWPRSLRSRDRERVDGRRGASTNQENYCLQCLLLRQDTAPGVFSSQGVVLQSVFPTGRALEDLARASGMEVQASNSLWTLQKEELSNHNELQKEAVSTLFLEVFK